jgi:hypothetical protein
LVHTVHSEFVDVLDAGAAVESDGVVVGATETGEEV